MYETLLYIHQNLFEKITCADAARHSGYSLWRFCTLFHQFTGRSFVEYVRYYRMQYALQAILSGERVTEVAMRRGYDSVSGFQKAFLSEFGCSPREMIRSNREKYLSYQRRRLSMCQLTDRCAILRDEAMNLRSYNRVLEPQYTIWREVARREAGGNETKTEMVAKTISLLADNIPVIIRDGEWIVGDNYGVVELPKDVELDSGEYLRQSGLDEAQCRRVLAAMGQKPAEYPQAEVPYTEQERQLEEEWAAIGDCIDSNHSVIGYEKVLRLGFEGLLQEVEKLAPQHPENAAMYRAAAEICRAGCRIGERYAAEAEKMAAVLEDGEERKAELLQIARVCRQVPRRPAGTLHEAIQSLWFAHIFNTWEDNINANSVGRLDQILYPYYRADTDAGRLTESGAFELICCLWIKLYRDYDVQQSCVGGCKPDGSDAVNRLSWLMLDATEQLDFIRCLSVRFSPDTDKAFVSRALEVVGHVGKGIPFFFNDAVMIPALTGAGIALEDARDYTQIGCVETVIPGKSNPHAVTGRTNLLKALEYTLLDGGSMVHPGYEPGIHTGNPEQFTTYEQLEAAVFAQIDHILDVTCRKVSERTRASMTNTPRPYKSLLTEGCLTSGRDFNQHGAQYDYYQVMLGGVPNLADSLEVLRKFVYQEKKYTLTQVIDALKNDFPQEKMRREFIEKAPKYGNDIDEVDLLAGRMIEYACDRLEQMTEKYGLSFHAQPFTYWWMLDEGKQTGASPDGRHSGEVIAYSLSPMQGRDFSGFLALMSSISKLPTKRSPGTTSAIVEVDPVLFNDSNIERFADIVLAAAARGLSNVQFNVVSLDTLQDARKHPEKHRNLAVRVSGFSQKFNLLVPELQDHIIERKKHQCL